MEKNDKRIIIINQNNTGPGIARNVGMKKSKGEYLIFLDLDDIFEKTMLENLYTKIKKKMLKLLFVIQLILKHKINIISNKKIKNHYFSSFDIKKDFFILFVWWPWDKLFKKKYIENLAIKFQNLRSSEDLFFVASAVVAAKKFSF